MNKKTDFSEIGKKLNIGGIVKSIQSIINPEIPVPADGDVIGAKLAEIRRLVQEIVTQQDEITKELAKVNLLAIGLEKDIELLRNPAQSSVAAAQEREDKKES